MRLYTMECVYDPETAENPFSPGMIGQEEYFIKLETKAEDEKYYRTVGGFRVSYQDCEDWNDYMIPRLGEAGAKTDDDIYEYIVASSPEIEVGDTYEDVDNLIWKKVE